MSRLKTWIARASIISVAAAIEFSSRFARTAILSRLLLPAEFGTAVAITVAIGTAELVTDVAFDKFVMVNSDEDSSLAAAHILSIIRGVLLALVFIVSGPSIAAFFGVPQFSASFALVALVPFVRSFSHLGIVQVQRSYDYAPGTCAQLFAQAAALVAAFAGAYVLRDHRAILVSYVMEALVYCAASHALARKPYQLRSNQVTLYAAISFGIPLLINGGALAILSQLDRMLIGHWLDRKSVV